MADLIDSYSETNQDTEHLFITGGSYIEGVGQAITLTRSFFATSCKFYVNKGGNPTGTAYAKIYAATGTVGTNAVPTGSALLTSAGISVSSMPTSPSLLEFTFTPTRITASNIVLCLEIDNSGDLGNYVRTYSDASSPGHGGNLCLAVALSTYAADAAKDLVFYLYGGYTSKGGIVMVC